MKVECVINQHYNEGLSPSRDVLAYNSCAPGVREITFMIIPAVLESYRNCTNSLNVIDLTILCSFSMKGESNRAFQNHVFVLQRNHVSL